MKSLHVNSEIGKLKKVLLHKPGKELENLTPEWLERLLFDDIPWLELARKEHDAFSDVFRQNGVEVVYLEDLVSETLNQSDELKQQFITKFIDEANVVTESLRYRIADYLSGFKDTKEMVLKSMAGIQKNELPSFTKQSLSDYIDDYPFATDPMPNLYFTRDPFSTIGNGISMNKMYTETRRRETLYSDIIFKHHNDYKKVNRYYDRDFLMSLEGGDILVLNDKLLAVGISQRTHPVAIDALAKTIFYHHNTNFETILAFDIPKSRAFMHLDTVFTQIDHDKFTLHNRIDQPFKVYELTKHSEHDGEVSVKQIVETLDNLLAHYLKRPVTLIPCGGGDQIISGREQWNDGANTLALAPGEVIVYSRNHVTNKILTDFGIKIHTIPSSELSRGRGGPRCMSMPLIREDL